MDTRVDLYWIPLGAGGAASVRISGGIYERMCALVRRRSPLDLYHTALELHVGADRFVIENAWPSPHSDTRERGVVAQGPVWSPWLGRIRIFRYEVRCWPGGTISDASDAVAITTVTSDPVVVHRLLDLTGEIPVFTWGRRVAGSDEMWNSNSVISHLLTRGGLRAEELEPPPGGRAPGWLTGITLARKLSATYQEMGTVG